MASVPSRPLPGGVREVREADTCVGLPPPSDADVRAAHAARTAGEIRTRLVFAGVAFLVAAGAGGAAEHGFHPERSPAVWLVYAVDLLAWGTALALTRVPRFAPHTLRLAVAVAVVVSLTMSAYARHVGGELELFTMGQLCLLCGLSAFVPWGARAQAVVGVVAFGGLAAAAPALTHAIHPAYNAIVLVTATATSVAGAAFIERLRVAEYTRSACLAHASAAHREEAEVSSALFQVAQALHAQLDRRDLVPNMNRLGVDVLGCDDCYLYLRDGARDAYRLHAHSGLRADILARIGDLEFTSADPLFASLRAGALCEIADAEAQTLVPRRLLRLVDCAALLALPICRETEPIGMLVFAWRRHTEPFSRREHRLAFGIAHAATVALENARLVGELTASSRLKSQFLSTMSHELRTPLNVICGYADILAEGGFGPLDPEQWRAVAGIRRSTRHLIELVDAGADLHRLELGRDDVSTNVVDLNELFAEVRRELGAVDTTVVALRWRNALGNQPVVTDRAKLKTILKHLVGNALKFTARGEVSVTVDDVPGALVVRVRDTGIGIAPADLEPIFELFHQVDGSETRRFGGAGLGLHIVRRLVQRLGGTVAVESKPGTGSVFTVTLPAAPGTAAPA